MVKRILFLISGILVFAAVAWAIELDVDGNGALDLNKGGTNATTAAAARASIGMGNVDNTSDVNKPVSSAVSEALNLKVGRAEFDNYSTATQVKLDGKADSYDLELHEGLVNNPHAVTAEQLGLGSAAFANLTSLATAVQGAKADTALQPGDIVTTLTDYLPNGYVTDGSVDYAAEIAAWLGSGGRRLYAPAGTWRSDAEQTIPDGAELFGDGTKSTIFDFSSMADRDPVSGSWSGFSQTGTLGTPTTLTASPSAGATAITVADATGFVTNDVILIKSPSEAYAAGETITASYKGELMTVASVSGTTVNLKGALLFGYDHTATTTPTVTKITAKAAYLHDFKVNMGGINSFHDGLKFTYTRGVKVERVEVSNAENTGVWFNTSLSPSISGSYIHDNPQRVGHNTGYSVLVDDATRDAKILNNRLEYARHGVAGGGVMPAIYVQVSGNTVTDTTDMGLDNHEPSFYWSVTNNIVEGCNGGINGRGLYIKTSGNTLNNLNGKGIVISQYPSSGTAPTTIPSIQVTDNVITNLANTGIFINGDTANTGAAYDGVVVSNNTVSNSVWQGIYIKDAKKVNLTGNNILDVSGAGADGIYANNVEDLTVNGGTISVATGTGNYAIQTVGGSYETISGLNYRNSPGLSLSAAVKNVSGGIGPTGADAISVSASVSTLSDTTISSPAAKQYLRHDGTNWKNSALLVGDLPASGTWALTGDLLIQTPSYAGQLRVDDNGRTIISDKGSKFGIAGNGLNVYGNTAIISEVDTEGAIVSGYRSRASSGALQTSDSIGEQRYLGWDGSAYVRGGFSRLKASQAWTGTNRGTIYELFTRVKDGGAEAVRMTINDSGNAEFSGSVTAPTFIAKNFTETPYAPTGTTINVSLANGGIQRITTTAATTVNLPALTSGQSLTLNICQGATPYAVTWGGTTPKWQNGVAYAVDQVANGCSKVVLDNDGVETMAVGSGVFQ